MNSFVFGSGDCEGVADCAGVSWVIRCGPACIRSGVVSGESVNE